MKNIILAASDLETGVEQLVEAQEALQESGATASTVSTLMQELISLLMSLAATLVEAAIVAAIGWYITKLLHKWFRGFIQKFNMDDGTEGFLSSVFITVLRVLLVLIVIGVLGIPMSSVIALVGSAGLAIGLALQGCLTNFAGGVLLLIVKPFAVGDYIVDTDGGHEGTVTNIGIIYTQIVTPDNRAVTIPNGTLADSTVTNVTHEKERRVEFDVGISYDEDIDKVRSVLMSACEESGFRIQERDCFVYVKSFDSSSICMTLRFWVKAEDYWPTQWDMKERIKKTFDLNHISIPYDQLDVHFAEEMKGK